MILTKITGGIAVAALALTPATLVEQQDAPPSVAQLCAATSITEVDALLAGVAESGLAGQLEPLLSLTVPDADAVTLRGDVTLDEVRERLDCEPATEEVVPEPTTPAPPPSEVPAPTDPPSSVAPTETPGGGDGFSQLDEVPSLPAQTGGGPA